MTSTTFLVTIPLDDDELLALEDIALDIQDALIDEFGDSVTVKPWSRHDQAAPSALPTTGLFSPAPPSPYL